METRSSQIVRSGIKINSMYEKDVICDATVDETNNYYAIADKIQNGCNPTFKPAIEYYDVSNVKYKGPKLVVEILDDMPKIKRRVYKK